MFCGLAILVNFFRFYRLGGFDRLNHLCLFFRYVCFDSFNSLGHLNLLVRCFWLDSFDNFCLLSSLDVFGHLFRLFSHDWLGWFVKPCRFCHFNRFCRFIRFCHLNRFVRLFAFENLCKLSSLSFYKVK